MLPKVFAIYHPSTETFQVLQTDVEENGSIARLKNWSRPSLRDWSLTATSEKADLMRWGRGVEWYVCKTNKALSDADPPIYKQTIHDKTYHFWFLNHMLVWSDHATYRSRHGETKEAWMKSPMIPVLEFATKQIYPRTNTGFYTYWSETNSEAIEAASEVGREAFQNSGQMEEHDHVDPRYLRIRTPSPRDDDWDSSEDCCHSEARKRGRGFSDATDSIDDQINALCSSQRFATMILGGLFCLWFGSVALTMVN